MKKIEATYEERMLIVKIRSIISVMKGHENESWAGTWETFEEMENLLDDMLHGVEIPQDLPINDKFEPFPSLSEELIDADIRP